MSPVAPVTLSIVMVAYKCRQFILDCLESLYAAPSRVAFEVIVVDNASADDTAAAIQAQFPEVTLVALDTNIGFGRGCNAGAELARGELILLLNPDTLVRPNAIDNLVALAEREPHAGIWGGRTVTPDGEIVPGSCWRFPTLWSTFCVSSGLSRAFENSALFNREAYGGEPVNGIRPVEVVSGCLFLIRRSLWNQLGGFDPAYFMYSEEVDLCLRAYRAGARPLVSSDVEIVHLVGKTQPVRADRLVRLLKGKRTYMLRHWSGIGERAGAMLLLAWPLSRYLGLKAAAILRRGREDDRQTWGEVWARRNEWLPGWGA